MDGYNKPLIGQASTKLQIEWGAISVVAEEGVNRGDAPIIVYTILTVRPKQTYFVSIEILGLVCNCHDTEFLMKTN